MDEIRITKIQVKNLFGRVDFNIDLSTGNAISIFTAPNGMGKTTVFNLVAFMFVPSDDSYSAIRDVPLDVFRCALSNGKTVEFKPVEPQRARKGRQNEFMPSLNPNRKDYIFTVYNGEKAGDEPLRFLTLQQEAFKTNLTDYFDSVRKTERTDDRTLGYVWRRQLEYLEKNGCRIPVNYVRADRIQPVVIEGDPGESASRTVSPLALACRAISDRIRQARDQYGEAVSKAKDELPLMFLSDDSVDMDYETFAAGWRAYREALTQYQEIGLIPVTEDFTKGVDLKAVYEEKGRFLSTYLRAFRKTTEPLKDIYERLRVFRSIINERNEITGKKIVFSKDSVSLITNGRAISPDILSSGEKHDFMMFYNLIFNSVRGSLVLIDEPEISLHIEWQETYIDKLIDICKMNSLQAVIATHSPHIVNDHFDLLVNKNAAED